MSAETLQNLAASIKMIRKAAPLDFPPTLPIYAVASDQLDDDLREWFEIGLNGVTSPLADELLRPAIERSGLWSGRGLAYIVHDGLYWFEVLMTSLHELSHAIAEGFAERLEHRQPVADEYAPAFAAWLSMRVVAVPTIEPTANVNDHGRRFARAFAHLIHRTESHDWAEDWFSRETPTAQQILAALEGEATEAHMAGLSIGSILDTDEPDEFKKLFDDVL